MFDINSVNYQIKKNKIFNKIILFKKIDSTNNFLKSNDFPTGTIVLSETQTSGKGKYGKKWISPKGGLWFSCVINKRSKRPYFYVILSSLAVVDTLKNYAVDAKIKWPNDILIRHKKVSGILVENDYYKGKIIIGVGINVNNKVPKNTDIKATSLKIEKKQKIDIQEFFLKVIKKLDFYLFNLKNKKNLILKKWIKNQVDLKNMKIKIFKNKILKTYEFLKLNKNGSVKVRDENGRIKTIKSDIFFM
jgi:BirA family biotin operon repressor/biotin-[acetyl-CoA-carboxylase] ligase